MTDDSRVHLVLGASGGIGSALCRRLAAGGALLAVGARGEEPLRALAGELGTETEVLPLDATDADQVGAAVSRTLERFGRLDGLAHCVGSILLKPAHLTTDEEWNATVALNLGSAFHALRAAVRPMMKSRSGSIVLVSTAAARLGLAAHEAIAAAKGGVQGLALAAAATYASFGIRVNVVAPGLVRTPGSERITSRPAAEKASRALHPLGRLGEPGDVASLMAWLLGPESGWTTGQVFGVDGGLATLKTRP